MKACLKPCVTFHSNVVFNGEELLVPCPTPKLEDHPLLAISSIHTPIMHHAVVTGTHITGCFTICTLTLTTTTLAKSRTMKWGKHVTHRKK
jgi:hypothetical protein